MKFSCQLVHNGTCQRCLQGDGCRNVGTSLDGECLMCHRVGMGSEILVTATW